MFQTNSKYTNTPNKHKLNGNVLSYRRIKSVKGARY